MLLCADGSYYTGSTNNLERRIFQHQAGESSNHTKKRLPIKLIYFEEYERIDLAFYREKQVRAGALGKKKL
ncbi:GIY-YIG nuclease family protein [Chryseobacterium oranimense]|uniref:GIY-YIG nuclease family protein n=1 Tax=Chryseobacterium oranimense TaxID=421058 RepID=UPI0021AFFBD3|nr:GIY-YIG nuclease family protein [Chryseobacterium oranimense]UWX61528.1 GIY-YIG nuclease family protein [Chryseobacterium oranimense]